MEYFTKFEAEAHGPNVSYPQQAKEDFGFKPQWVGEMDPASNHPLNLDKNLLDTGVTKASVWDLPFNADGTGNTMMP